MNHCPPFEELNALIDGELFTEHELALRWHLDICTACTQHAAAVAALKRAVGRAGVRETPSPGLRRSVMTRLPKRRSWRSRARAIAAPL
jgi:anti-sigma factor RsiW